MIVVTGAAGFIGSNIIAALNERGTDEIIVCDRLGVDERWHNLRKRMFLDFIPPEDLMGALARRTDISAVIHMGAISSTTVTDGDLLMRENYRYTLQLIDWCTLTNTPIVYASSAATYGDGSQGFDDDWSLDALKKLRPLNLYGWSKHLVDLAVSERFQSGKAVPPKCIGLKFFNVYGQNEYHKADMQSVVTKIFPMVRDGLPISLFKSHRDGIPHGGQERDFVYVDDVVSLVLWLIDAPVTRGIFNVGTGKARSFADLARAVFAAVGQPEKIVYSDMPESIRSRYQYFTEASMDRIRDAGWQGQAKSLEDSVRTYIENYLQKDDRFR